MDGVKLTSAVASRDELLFLPLGGAGEIGMNLNLYGLGGKWLMIDCGVTFAGDDMPGIDLLMPDPTFIADRRADLLALVLTHAHEDHLGAVAHLWQRLRCPIYATPFTASVLHRKLQEANLVNQVPVHRIDLSDRLTIGPFDLELITLTHSIPEPNAIAIRTAVGTILHTGDWKFDPDPLVGEATDFAALRRVGDEGVLALVGDSTNVFKPGVAGSEAEVRSSLVELVANCPNRVAVACFASNIARVESAVHAALANDRRVTLVGRSLKRMVDAAQENGYLQGLPAFIDEAEAGYLPRDKIMLLVTGSQGEPRAALSRIASDDHPEIILEEGDTVIFSSRIIPGNELSINRLQDRLARQGVEIITERDAFVHVSGHPARDELAQMYQLIRPRLAIPVHGELRHMIEHAKLAETCQVPQTLIAENGTVVALGPGTPRIIDRVPTGRLALDGGRLQPAAGETLRLRRKLAEVGSAMVTLVIGRDGRLATDPQVSLPGIAHPDTDIDLLETIEDAIGDAIDALPNGVRREDNAVKDLARTVLRRQTNQLLGRKPIVEVHLVRL